MNQLHLVPPPQKPRHQFRFWSALIAFAIAALLIGWCLAEALQRMMP